MPRKRGIRVAILVEDEALERLVREVLLKFGFSRYEVRVTSYPVGQGSAKAWVDKQYPLEVKALRRKGHQSLGLVVGTDADELTVRQRVSGLANALQNEAATARRPNERIVLWIPKWNVETWLLYFVDDPRDEDHDYKHAVRRPDYSAAAQRFVDEYRQHKTDQDLDTQPSLSQAYQETQRFGRRQEDLQSSYGRVGMRAKAGEDVAKSGLEAGLAAMGKPGQHLLELLAAERFGNRLIHPLPRRPIEQNVLRCRAGPVGRSCQPQPVVCGGGCRLARAARRRAIDSRFASSVRRECYGVRREQENGEDGVAVFHDGTLGGKCGGPRGTAFRLRHGGSRETDDLDVVLRRHAGRGAAVADESFELSLIRSPIAELERLWRECAASFVGR